MPSVGLPPVPSPLSVTPPPQAPSTTAPRTDQDATRRDRPKAMDFDHGRVPTEAQMMGLLGLRGPCAFGHCFQVVPPRHVAGSGHAERARLHDVRCGVDLVAAELS